MGLFAGSTLGASTLVALRAGRALGHRLHLRGYLYPALSAATIGATVIAERGHPGSWNFARAIGLIVGGVCAFTDIQVGYIYDKVLMLGALVLLVIAAILDQTGHAIVGSLGGLALPLATYVSTRGRALGFGDVKLAAFLGAATGLNGVPPMLITACIAAAVIGCILVAVRQKRWSDTLPFGPFLVLGAWVAIMKVGP